MNLEPAMFFLAAFSAAIALRAEAAETQLICHGIEETSVRRSAGEHIDPATGQTVKESVRIPVKSEVIHEIRFDESARTFWYRGNDRIGHLNAQDGWVPASSVVFGERTIEVSFDKTLATKARAVLSLGIDLLINPPATQGQLDRYSGVWRIGSLALSCNAVDQQQRRF